MTFRLTREAEEDVAAIYRYSFKNFGEAQADTYHDGLTGCFHLLVDTPLIGLPVTHIFSVRRSRIKPFINQ
jgi:toxin ParE1/3/4